MRRVVDARHAPLAQRDDPLAEVANVDRLRRVGRRRGGEDLASSGNPVGPVREAAGWVVRPGDEPRPDDERAVGEHVDDRPLAECLQRAVALVRHLVLGKVAQRGDRAVLVNRNAEIRIHRDAGHEAVQPRARERLRGRTDHARQVAARVDDGIPVSTLQHAKVAGPIADQPLDLRVQLGIRPAAVEERQLVAAGEGGFRDGTAQEQWPTEEEKFHASAASPSSRRSTSSSVL